MTASRELLLHLFVEGDPVPQGSLSPKRNRATGKVVLPQSPKLLAWRAAIATAATLRWREPLLDEPIELELYFWLARPAKPRFDFPATKPDNDKLARAVGDALEGFVYVNDSRIIDTTICKRYAEKGVAKGVDVWIYRPC